MIAPDLFKIKPPKAHLHFQKSETSSSTTLQHLSEHFFNHSVVAVFPDTLQVPSEIKDIFTKDTQYYLLKDCPIYSLVDYKFIENFIKNGNLTLLSVGTLLDVDNTCCITPSGFLVLSVQRNSYLSLGVEQGPAVKTVYFKNSNRYLIEINLKHKSFSPDKNNYKRILKQLYLSKLSLDFVLAWDSEDPKICPSSIASYFHQKGVHCEECLPEYSEKRVYDVSVPSLKGDLEELYQWLGLFLLGATDIKEGYESEYLSSYKLPEEREDVGQVLIMQMTGLITSSKVTKLAELIRDYLTIRSSLPWAALHQHGFEDAPVSWGLEPHHYSVFGDNHVTNFFSIDGTMPNCKVFTSSTH